MNSPGAMPLTRTPSGRSSCARVAVACPIADFEYMYGNVKPDVAGSLRPRESQRAVTETRKCTCLRPAVHTGCHHNLGSEPSATRARFPLFEKGKECEREPVWADCVRMEAVLEVLLGDPVEVRLAECFCIRDRGLCVFAQENSARSTSIGFTIPGIIGMKTNPALLKRTVTCSSRFATSSASRKASVYNDRVSGRGVLP